MISKNKISEIRKLHQKKFRDAERLFIVEGRKSVEMLLQSDFQIVELFATEEVFAQNRTMLEQQPVTLVAPAEMERISTLSTPPELLAIAHQRQDLGEVPVDEPILVLDRIADPGNLGTIIRTADWFNFRHIVCSPDCVEFYNPKTIQATMGSFAHVHVHTQALVPFLRARADQHRILGAFLQGESIHEFAFQSTDIIVIGSESNGISPEVAKLVTTPITIPTPAANRATAESLNAAVATSIILYQASKSIQ